EALDGQTEVLYPRREHIAKDAPGFLDVEFPSRSFLLHECWSLARWPFLDAFGGNGHSRRGLKMPDLRPYDEGGGSSSHVQAIDVDFQRDRAGSRPQWLHQMRSDLGRLDTIAEILQIGPALTEGRRAWRCGLRGG